MSTQIGFTILPNHEKATLLEKLKRRKENGFYRKGSFSDEIIWDDRKFVFPVKQGIGDSIWIFRSVLNDVKKFIENNAIKEKKRLPVNLWNQNLIEYNGQITATDVNHAYWRIAYLQGVISKKTYEKGLTIQSKDLRLAALANLASMKEYQIIENGLLTEKTKVLKYDPIMKRVYNNIRFSCYEHMINMSKLLNEDFICYKTDCIYYIDNYNNRKLVHKYLDVNNLEYKQLVEIEITDVNEKKKAY